MAGTATLLTTEVPVAAPHSRRLRIALPDVLIALALGTIAFIVRRHVPADGLFYDDAWQTLGAWKGSFSELITVGQTQLGFTAGLMVWTRLFGVGSAAMVTPALIAGTLGPPALYIVLRRFHFSRSTSLLAGAALASAQVHIEYSYHVKTYPFDVLIVLGLALVVWQVARLRWRTSTAIAWCIASIVVGSFSSIALIATVMAGFILVLHPSGDRMLRALATAIALLALAMLTFASSRTYSYELIHGFFASRDGYIDFDPNPVNFGREVFNHLWYIADVFPHHGPTLSLALATVGLVSAAWRSSLALPARFLVLMVVAAAAGSIVGLIPFGPPRTYGRLSLWLVPAIALGMCTALEFARRRIMVRSFARTGFDISVCTAAALVLVSAFGNEHPYLAGARGAVRQVMADAGLRDAVLITRPTSYSFALYANTPVDLRNTPERAIGFLPEFSDQRLLVHDFTTTLEELDDFIHEAERVYVVHANVDPAGYAAYRYNLAVTLTLMGLERHSSEGVETGRVDVWLRRASGSPS
jgi:hypothetical protein